jgi:hypothetical protein
MISAVNAFRGSGVGGSVARLLADRQAERETESPVEKQG